MLYKDFWSKYDTADYVGVPVNCVGVMGAGLAKVIACKAPAEDILAYKKECNRSLLDPDKPCPGDVFKCGRHLFCFSKNHWVQNSQLSWIEKILENLTNMAEESKTLLLPQIGSGLGGLSEHVVMRLYDEYCPKMKWKEVIYK